MKYKHAYKASRSIILVVNGENSKETTTPIIFNHLHPSPLLHLLLSPMNYMFEMSRKDEDGKTNLCCAQAEAPERRSFSGTLCPRTKHWSFTARHGRYDLHMLDTFPRTLHLTVLDLCRRAVDGSKVEQCGCFTGEVMYHVTTKSLAWVQLQTPASRHSALCFSELLTTIE